MSDEAAARLDRTLAALADPQRRRVVDLRGQRPHRAGELADQLGLSPPAMSRHLKTLRLSGLVEERHDGFDARVRVYQLRPKPMTELATWLSTTEAMWSMQLDGFRAHMLDKDAVGDAVGEGG